MKRLKKKLIFKKKEFRKNSLNQEILINLKKPRCHSMMVENDSRNVKENNEFFFEEDLEENEKRPEKIIEPIIKPKDPFFLWQSYEKERICDFF